MKNKFILALLIFGSLSLQAGQCVKTSKKPVAQESFLRKIYEYRRYLAASVGAVVVTTLAFFAGMHVRAADYEQHEIVAKLNAYAIEQNNGAFQRNRSLYPLNIITLGYRDIDKINTFFLGKDGCCKVHRLARIKVVDARARYTNCRNCPFISNRNADHKCEELDCETNKPFVGLNPEQLHGSTVVFRPAERTDEVNPATLVTINGTNYRQQEKDVGEVYVIEDVANGTTAQAIDGTVYIYYGNKWKRHTQSGARKRS